ncbi:LysR family transcriptional regulator [Arenibaculum pallidiluteum]|uniref:LysR family transcriptional regulator n=1 Tax=Arenibaculum pallidiluteum TaxID=2812559 RepID=UPI001A961C59|nr:LysR family transcriptional regulator [Arenibaculum pallidiluteum]
MKTLDWTLLRSFLAVVETGSLSAAALRIGATQPTLSRHVRELETALGVPLFRRSARGLDPTDAALGLVDDARAMGAAAEALALKALGRSQQLTGTVRVTASTMVSNLWLPVMLAELRVAEPSIQVELVPSDLNQNLLRRDADIAIRMVDPTQNALIARKLGDAPVGLYGARSYFARRGRISTMQDLLEHDVIGFDRSEVILKLYAAAGHPVAREAFPLRCDDQMVCWNLLLAGAGVGFAQVLLADRHPSLERVPIDMVPPMPVWLVMHEDVRSNARIRRVADFLAASIGDLLRTA